MYPREHIKDNTKITIFMHTLKVALPMADEIPISSPCNVRDTSVFDAIMTPERITNSEM